MSKQFTNVEVYGDNILVRWAGGDKQRIPFRPSLFVVTDEESEWKTLDGSNAKEIKFDSIRAAKDWIKMYSQVDNFEFHGSTNWQQQFLLTTEDEWSEEPIKSVMIDIEVEAKEGFPNIEQANEAILLITVLNKQNNQFVTWGKYPVVLKTEYRCFEDEKMLLKDFILWWAGNGHPDLVTGWNSEGFDMPYLINRIDRVLGTEFVMAMSPWRKVDHRMATIQGKEVQHVKISGIEQLDYMELYKKFNPGGRESFSLDFISEYELGEKKLDFDSVIGFQLVMGAEYVKVDKDKPIEELHEFERWCRMQDKIRSELDER